MNEATANSDEAILAALNGIVRMQRTSRNGTDVGRDTGLVFLRVYHQRLPATIARRLTRLDPQTVASIPRGMAGASDTTRRILCDALTNDGAFAQAIRAANVYREKLGRELLGPDGNPEQREVEV